MFDLLISLHFITQKPSKSSLIHFNSFNPQVFAQAEIVGILMMRTKASLKRPSNTECGLANGLKNFQSHSSVHIG